MLWFLAAWIGGSALILGGLMAIGSLLLWSIPAAAVMPPAEGKLGSLWLGRLKVLGFAVAIALAGLGLLAIVPFPG